MKPKETPRGVPYTPAQARSSARSLMTIAESQKNRATAANYSALAQTLLDYADLREAEQSDSEVAL